MAVNLSAPHNLLINTSGVFKHNYLDHYLDHRITPLKPGDVVLAEL